VIFGPPPKEFTGYDLIVAHDVNGTYPVWLDETVKHTPVINFHHCVYKAPVPKEKFVARLTTSEHNQKLLGADHELVGLPMELPPYTKDLRSEYGIGPDDFVVGRMGRFEEVKRVIDFVEAAGLIKKQIPNVKFVLAGGDNFFGDTHAYIMRLKKRAEELGVELIFIRGFKQEDKTNILKMFDVFLYPTTEEGYCLAMVEAMLAKIPIVTYDTGPNMKTTGGFSNTTPTIGHYADLADLTILTLRKGAKVQQAYELASKRNDPVNFSERLNSIIHRFV
jgi:glycosyltransferase involved in cell wall biosynthesis